MAEVAFIGIDLQRDLCVEGAPLEVRGAPDVVRSAVRLATFARETGIPLILTQSTNEEDDPCFESLPPHNVIGTPGHDLIQELGIADHVPILDRPNVDIGPDRSGLYVICSPEHRRGLFANLNADRLLSTLDASEYVLFGATLEMGVRAAALGLRERDKTTILVSDGLGCLDEGESTFHLAALAGAGCRFLTTAGVLERYG